MYLFVFLGILVYLWWLGADPWGHLFENWKIFLVLFVLNGIGIVVQASSFKSIYPGDLLLLSTRKLVRIWSFSGMISVIAPVLAGLATRTTLLIQSGMSLSMCVSTSARQLWLGLEYAFLLGGISGFFIDVYWIRPLATGFVVSWMVMVLLRITRVEIQLLSESKLQRWLRMLKLPISNQAHLWFSLQMLVMSAIYYVAYNGYGASIGWDEALLLSSITVLASLIVITPNGLGLMDVLWVVIAKELGLSLDESVSLAISIRLAYLLSATFVWISLSFRWKLLHRNDE
ncbi:hypothetical protein MNBD_GAMMA03-1435 [hydrothermal vent metagenome]|uniref:Uncharacterized protein n=1 Tax=hydrothermal vent metagenome TaxID=652676 RepID=A0A3B0W6G1_9ZZZZ